MRNQCSSICKSTLITSPHGFSTRLGGVSTGIYDSLNLGMNRGDNKEDVIKNWDIFLDAAGIEKREFVCGRQVHGSYVHIATEADLRPAYGKGELIEADGYVTNIPGVPIAVFTADCVPVLMEDADNRVIAAVHMGWRSTVADIEKQAIDRMLSLGADTGSIRVAIGPSICEKCFQVGREVVDAADRLLSGDIDGLVRDDKEHSDRYYLNLPGVIERRLISLGIGSDNIDIIRECTMCYPDKYWSHRYTGGERGSQANIIML